MVNLYNDYCPDCGDQRINLALNDDKTSLKELSEIADNTYKKLYKNKGYQPGDLTQYSDLIGATNMIFKQALKTGIVDNIVPERMRTSLENDVFVFSALKTHAQLFEASRLLLNEDGSIKSFQQFSQDVKSIKDNYNHNYLEAEYQFAVSSAQQAAHWQKIEANEGRYNLQYRTANDERVRASHAALNGITLSVSDAFWNEYYPPNGWRCRCKAIEVLKRKYPESAPADAIAKGQEATSNLGKDGENRLEIFRFNPGKEKVIFPPNHPYRKIQGAEYVIQQAKKGSLDYLAAQSGSGTVLIHRLAELDAPDFNAVETVAKALAKEGRVVKINPKFHSTLNNPVYDLVFGDLKGTKYWGKCPDLKVDNVFYEHEGFSSNNPKSAFKNMLNRGLKQSSYVIIEDCDISERYAINNILSRIKEGQDISEVWIRKGNQLKQLYKKTEAQ